MLALVLCVSAITFLYVSPIIRKCCRKGPPVSAELLDEYKDL